MNSWIVCLFVVALEGDTLRDEELECSDGGLILSEVRRLRLKTDAKVI